MQKKKIANLIMVLIIAALAAGDCDANPGSADAQQVGSGNADAGQYNFAGNRRHGIKKEESGNRAFCMPGSLSFFQKKMAVLY